MAQDIEKANFNLSEMRISLIEADPDWRTSGKDFAYLEWDVKEFIKRLKKEFDNCVYQARYGKKIRMKIIDKLAGEKLI